MKLEADRNFAINRIKFATSSKRARRNRLFWIKMTVFLLTIRLQMIIFPKKREFYKISSNVFLVRWSGRRRNRNTLLLRLYVPLVDDIRVEIRAVVLIHLSSIIGQVN